MSNSPTLVLLHGAGMKADVWDRLIPMIEVPAVALDVPGRKPDATPETCADEIADRLDEMDVGDVVLVLHSLSAVLAPHLGIRLEGLLRSCVFLSGVIPPPNKEFVDALPFRNRLRPFAQDATSAVPNSWDGRAVFFRGAPLSSPVLRPGGRTARSRTRRLPQMRIIAACGFHRHSSEV